MFKRLRTKLAEEAQRFPIQDLIDLNSSTGSPVLQPENEQFSINDEDDSNTSEMNSPSRTQEKTSAEQEAMHFTAPTLVVGHPETIDPLSVGTENSALQLGLKEYVTQSDTESEREELHSTDLEGISKEQLIFALQKFRRKTQKYKAHYTEAITAFKEVLSEKEKLQHALSDSQDKTLRRLAELREQCQLEQQAKAHLEQNLQMILDEKEQMISVLETKVRLLKEGNYSDKQGTCQCDNSNCFMDLEDKKSINEDTIKDDGGELQALREKIKRQEALLAKCKDTIRSNKERTSQLIDEKNNLLEQLDKKNREQENHQVQEPEIQSDLQVELAQMREKLIELEKQQEENSMAMAETKRNMHEELELREQQLCKLKSELQNVQREKDVLQKKVEEQDSKCIDLQNKHEEAISVLQNQLENTENSLEKERENLMHELSRGKAAAVSLVKEECGRKISTIEEEWKVKVEELKQEHQKVLAEKEESERKINSIEEEWKVKVEELKQEYKKAITEKEEYGRKINSIEEEWNGKLEELKQEHQKALTEKEKEHGKALNNQAEEFKNFLARKNEEMSPSVTDQGVQKTVTVSDIDIQTDDLQKETEELDDNRIKEDINLLNSKLREPLLFIEGNQSSISEELCDYKLQIAELHRTLDQLKQKNVEEESELKQKIEALQSENNKLITNVKALDDLQTEKEVIEDKLKQMEESCNKNNEANEIVLALQDEVKRLKEECSISASVQEELKRMKEENAISIELREENKQLKIKLDAHDKEKEEIKCTLQHEYSKLQSEKVKLEEELQKTKFRVELLNQQLTSKEPDDKTNLLMKEEIILLKEQLHLLETQTFGISHVDNYQNQLTIVKTNYEEKLKEKNIEHNSKLKQMVRDFASQMEQKETEYEKMLSTFIEKGQQLEGKMERKQREDMAALEQELHQKSCALEDVAEHYQQLLCEKEDELRNFKEKVKEAGIHEKTNGRVNEINQDVLQVDANDWEDGWVDAEDTTSIPPTVVKAEIHNQESTQCTEHLEHIKTLESSIASSQEEISELRFLLGLTNRAASSSDANYTNEILQKLPEPTEFEYLRNILYEYMMGKEPMILARVIAAVLKFTEEQTREILQRETIRQTLKNNWMSS